MDARDRKLLNPHPEAGPRPEEHNAKRRLRDEPLLPLPYASSAVGLATLSERVQTALAPEGGPHGLERQYVQAVLARYLWLPDTPNQISRHDRRLARTLFERGIPVIVVEAALLLGTCRRAFREPYLAPLPQVRSMHYFLPVITEVLENPRDPDPGYLEYLLRKLRPLAELKVARLQHRAMYGDTE